MKILVTVFVLLGVGSLYAQQPNNPVQMWRHAEASCHVGVGALEVFDFKLETYEPKSLDFVVTLLQTCLLPTMNMRAVGQSLVAKGVISQQEYDSGIRESLVDAEKLMPKVKTELNKRKMPKAAPKKR